MNWRSAGIVIGILVVLCATLALSVVYPFSTSEPHSESPPEQQFSFEETDEYRISGSVMVDDQTQFGVDGVMTSDGERYAVIDHERSLVEEYQSGPDEDTYGRMTFEDEAYADRWIEAEEENDDREVLQIEREGDETAVIFIEKSTDRTENTLANEAEVVIGSLSAITYEQTHQTDVNATYEPQDAWIEQTDRRITDTAGDVKVDTETRAVKSADVSWEQTRLPRLTFLNYLLTTVAGDESTTIEVTYEFETDDVDLEPPDWLTDVQSR
ncbi:hypothetical protein [Natronorubrum sp. A-ect3]|uniref:hypothetical protein n=1 Tax=Natronorubrum sp. A-ect3 TaxID=3242698 RepID=UPI00359D08D3